MSAPSLGAGLEGAGVLVTGAVGGIGSAVAHAFAECGARVAVSDLSEDAGAELAASLPGDGHAGLGADLADVASHTALVAAAAEAVGPARAPSRTSPRCCCGATTLREIDEADWDAQVDVNFKGTFFLNRAFAEHLRGRGTDRARSSTSARRAGGPAASAAPSSTTPRRAGSSP